MAESKRPRPEVNEGDAWLHENRVSNISALLEDIHEALRDRNGIFGTPFYNVKVSIDGLEGQMFLARYFKDLKDAMITLLEKFQKVSDADLANKGHEVISAQDQAEFERLMGQINHVKYIAYKLEPFSKSDRTARSQRTLLECFDDLTICFNIVKTSLHDTFSRAEEIRKIKLLEEKLALLTTALEAEKNAKAQMERLVEEKNRAAGDSEQRNAALEKINQELKQAKITADEKADTISQTIQTQQLMINQLQNENARLKAQLPEEEKSKDRKDETETIRSAFENVNTQLAGINKRNENVEEKANNERKLLQGLQISPKTRLVVGEGLGLGTIAIGVVLGLLATPVGWIAAGIVIAIGVLVCAWSGYEAWNDSSMMSEIEKIPFRMSGTNPVILDQSVSQIVRLMPNLQSDQSAPQSVSGNDVVSSDRLANVSKVSSNTAAKISSTVAPQEIHVSQNQRESKRM